MAGYEIPQHSKALHATEAGQALQTTTVPVPELLPNSVLVKVLSTALNPHDSLVQRTGMLIPSFPFIPGADVAGTVLKLGPGVDKYKVGDVVFGQINWPATSKNDKGEDVPRFRDFAGAREYALVDVRSSAKVDECGDGDGREAVDKAVTMPTNAVAAVWGFVDQTGFNLPLLSVFGSTAEERKKDGFDARKHDIVVIGGGAQVGKLVVQIARLMGWRKIVVVADALKNEAELKEMGATDIVDRHGGNEEMIRKIRTIVGDELRYCFNAVSQDKTVAVGVLSNTVEGHLNNVLYGEVKEKELVGRKGAGYKETLSQGQSLPNIEAAKRFWEKLPVWLKNGDLKVPMWRAIEGLDADKVMEVLTQYGDGKAVPEHVHIRP